jgi:hypothetical protein
LASCFIIERKCADMTPNSRSLRLPLQLVSLLLLSGCYGIPMTQSYRANTSELSRSMREKQMEVNWVGHPYEDLVNAYGKPQMIMSIPGRSLESQAAVFGRLDTRTDCIDAFTVVRHRGRRVVQGYFCR